jgi:membrane protein insertase Oxa1/YidC/SpoIIIJ
VITKPFQSTLVGQQQQQCRTLWTFVPAWIQDITATFPFWGHSAALLKTIHMDGMIPYWACFPLLNVLLRICLFPLVIHSAHVGIRFSKVAPDLQLLFAVYARDYQRLIQSGAGIGERWILARQTFRTMSSLLKYNQVNPLTFFYAPLLQIPVYYYCANDLRRVVRGADPDMAQALTDAPVSFWIPLLTEADPFNVLPSMAGLLFYLNLEYSLSPKRGERQTALIMIIKDVLQSVAVLTPAFLGSAPAGMQLYACTTFVITGFQSALVKNNTFRPWVGLPPLTKPTEDKEILEIQRKRDEAIKNELVGKGVLEPGTVAVAKWTTRVRSSVAGSAATAAAREASLSTQTSTTNAAPVFIHGITALQETGRMSRLSFVNAVPDTTTTSMNETSTFQQQNGDSETVAESTSQSLNVERKAKKDMPKRKKRRN